MNNSYVDNNTNIFQRSLLWETQQFDLSTLIPEKIELNRNGSSTDFRQLLKAISDRQLTESLEILERYGIIGKQALSFIAKFGQIDWSQSPYSEEVAL